MRYGNAEEFKNVCGYAVENNWYPRVTKILEIKAKPALDVFFKEVGSYEAAEEIKNKSAEHGTLVHEYVQKTAIGLPITPPEHIRPAVEAFQEFNQQRGIIFLPEFIEKQIWSPRSRYAGTVDALAMIDGKFGVLDIKTSAGFYPDYNLQTAAYYSALQEFEVKRTLHLPKDIETRWILRIDQHRTCGQCGATLRDKGGRIKIRAKTRTHSVCSDEQHDWGETRGEIALREFPYVYNDIRAFMATKLLWEWEHNYWLRTIGYTK